MTKLYKHAALNWFTDKVLPLIGVAMAATFWGVFCLGIYELTKLLFA